MDLLTRMLMRAIERLLDEKQVRARVECKLNRDGKRVIGVILDEHQPDFARIDPPGS